MLVCLVIVSHDYLLGVFLLSFKYGFKKKTLTLTILLLAVSDYRSSFGSGSVILDDCNFHESVRLDNFDLDRTLTLVSETKAT